MSDISVGSVSVDVVPNARGWVERLRAQIMPGVEALGVEIGRTLSTRINESLTDAHVTVDVDSAAADAHLIATKSLLESLGGSKEINVAIDSGGGAEAVAKSLGGAASSASALGPALVVAGLALIPLAASAAGLAASLVLPLAAAGGGLGLGAILAGKAIANTIKTAKEIDQLRQKANTLVDPKAAKAAADQADALEKSLTKPQRAFLKARDTLSKAFDGLLKGKTGDALFAPVVAGANLLAKILPKLSPVIVAVSDALVGLLDGLAKSASGDGFTKFIDGFAKLAGATITSGAKSIGLFIQGLFNIFKDFLPLSGSVGTGLEGLAAKFLAFSQKTSTKEGIQSFIDYVKENGPTALAFIGNLIVNIVRIGIALAPAAAKLVGFITTVSEYLNKIPIDKIKIGFGALLTAIFPAIAATKKIGGAFEDIGGVFRSVYNATLGPVLSLMLKAIGFVLKAAGDMLSILGKAPGFGWAKDLGNDLKDAADRANGVADAIKKIPKNTKVAITVTTISKDGKALGGGKRGNLTAVGGVFNGAQQRTIAEAGPEAVVPLNRPLSQVDPAVRQLSAFAQGLSAPGLAAAPSTSGSAAAIDYDLLAAAMSQVKVQVGKYEFGTLVQEANRQAVRQA